MPLVTRPNQVARSALGLFGTLALVTERKARIRSLDDTWADSTTTHGRLILTVVGGMAEFERELSHGRRAKVVPLLKRGR